MLGEPQKQFSLTRAALSKGGAQETNSYQFMKLLTLITLLCFLSQAHSSPMVYTFSGTGTGTLGAAPFTGAHFLITASADTRDFSQLGGGVSQILVQSASVQVSGFANGQFGVGLRLFQGPFYSSPPGSIGDATVGLSLATGPDLMDLFSHAFASYDLRNPLGPVVATPDYQSRLSFNNISTTIGPMTLTSSLNVTFTATVVPEPSGIVILVAGVAVLGLAARHRKSR
jgi:hypothetical protein